MNKWQDRYSEKLINLDTAVSKLEKGDKIWSGGLLSSPIMFLLEVDKNLDQLAPFELYTGLLTHPFEFLKPQYKETVHHKSLFMGPLERKIQSKGNVEVTNFHFSNFAEVFAKVEPNTMIIEVTEPDENGFMSMGACGGVGNKVALNYASKIIAVVNKFQPKITNKDNLLHIDQVNFITEGHHPIAGPKGAEPSDLEISIAEHVTPYIKDNMTIQIGIGTISNAMGMALKGHSGLGIHTEMFTESMMELCKAGAVNSENKNYKPNKIVTAFAAGSQELIDYIDGNPQIEMGCVTDVVNANVVAKNDNFASINTCVMVDLVGQVASEGVGHTQISGSGGQVDFVRGARMSNGGISILALASTHQGKQGLESTIRTALPAGTPVTTLRNDVQVIATEFGAADLRGLSTPERVNALIAIAHPDFRDSLLKDAIEAGLIKTVQEA
ncbi:acetyl-CoA hydrolase/transferase C-terminal domain-containing protein [uncultured Vibrio sp.]|mgnify:CR=1 FL=1|uniref:acetyl-CoA hydrolase/transferase family protein n=1 Tax=uncultured Vibrio sp. TaxID=114054 RepID=UPI0025F94A66|nr:acetyl-CoA hydrolase/transferase C-terminal domain-containing protein [uncultured Vibrio sp.]